MVVEVVGYYLVCVYFNVVSNILFKIVFIVDGYVQCIILNEYYWQEQFFVVYFKEVLQVGKVNFL